MCIRDRVNDGREAVDAEHAQIGDGEGGVGQLFGPQLAGPGPPAQVADLVRQAADARGGHVLDHRHDQPIVEGHGDADVDHRPHEQLVVAQVAVEGRIAPQRPGHGAGQRRRQRHLVAVRRPAFVGAGHQILDGGHVDVGLEGDMRGFLHTALHGAGDGAAHGAERLALRFDGRCRPGHRLGSRRRGGRGGVQRGLYVVRLNAPARPRPGDGGQIDP